MFHSVHLMYLIVERLVIKYVTLIFPTHAELTRTYQIKLSIFFYEDFIVTQHKNNEMQGSGLQTQSTRGKQYRLTWHDNYYAL